MSSEPPVGEPVAWRSAPCPCPRELGGAHVVLRPIDPGRDAAPLYAQSHAPAADPALWTYMGYGPYRDEAEMRAALARQAVSADPLFFALVPRHLAVPAGVAAYLRMAPEHGVIEIGHIWFAAALRHTAAATEAIYLLAEHVFDALGYRRLEWKCDALNAPSRRAAERFGFRFEGVFRKHMVVKGRNRDTAWYAVTDDEWPARRAGFRAWLSSENLGPDGAQHRPLEQLMLEAGLGR